MLAQLIPSDIKYELERNLFDLASITEIRLKLYSKMVVETLGIRTNLNYIPTIRDIDYILNSATNDSIYTQASSLSNGYVTSPGGCRIGICGEAIIANNSVCTYKNITGLVIRIPHNKYAIADSLVDIITKNGIFHNTILISPPGAGKTTMLRELARRMSEQYNIVIIDEKNEISGSINGCAYLDVGRSEVLINTPRKYGFESAIRNLAPEIIIVDEMFGEESQFYTANAGRCGVGLITSMHGEENTKAPENFDIAIYLSKKPCIGTISKIVEKGENVC